MEEQQVEIVKCIVGKEKIPKHQIDLNSLLATFERISSDSKQETKKLGSKDSNQYHSSGVVNGRGDVGPSSINSSSAEDDLDQPDAVVDQSQPAMAEILVKFRRLESFSSPSGSAERSSSSSSSAKSRSRSPDRRHTLEISGQEVKEAGLGSRKTTAAQEEDEEDKEQQMESRTMSLIAKFSAMAGETSSQGQSSKNLPLQRSRSFTSKGSSTEKEALKKSSSLRGPADMKPRKVESPAPRQIPMDEQETGVETQGMGKVQVLVAQWRALEKWRPKKTGFEPSTAGATKPKTCSTTYKVPSNGQGEPGSPGHHSDQGSKSQAKETSKKTMNGLDQVDSISNNPGLTKVGDKVEEEEEEAGQEGRDDTPGGITKKLLEKFRHLEKKQAEEYKQDSLPRTKKPIAFKWDVKESPPVVGLRRSSSLSDKGRAASATATVEDACSSSSPSASSSLSKTRLPSKA